MYFAIYLYLIAVYFPSSYDGIPSVGLQIAVNILGGGAVFFYLATSNTNNILSISLALVVLALLLLFTIYPFESEFVFDEIAWGGAMPIIMCLAVLNTNIKPSHININWISNVFLLTSIMNLLVILLQITNNEVVWNGITEYYNMGYEELIKTMKYQSKPVFTYGTHSVAAFSIYLFSVVALLFYLRLRNNIYLFVSIGYLISLFYIQSNTALFLIVYFLLSVSFLLFIKIEKEFKWIKAPFLIALIICFCFVVATGDEWNNVLTNHSNGFLARFSEHGVLENNLKYIEENVLGGVGLWVSESLHYTDSGYVLMALRVSAFGMLAFYLLFLRSLFLNVGQHLEIIILIAVPFMLFEIGYPGLLSSRIYFFIPFLWTCLYATTSVNRYSGIVKF